MVQYRVINVLEVYPVETNEQKQMLKLIEVIKNKNINDIYIT